VPFSKPYYITKRTVGENKLLYVHFNSIHYPIAGCLQGKTDHCGSDDQYGSWVSEGHIRDKYFEALLDILSDEDG